MSIQTYSLFKNALVGDTQTGLDQLVNVIGSDTGLIANNWGSRVSDGQAAANGLNRLIVDAINATGAGATGTFTANDVITLNQWIRENRLTQFLSLYGDNTNNTKTGFSQVQNSGGIQKYRGLNFIDTVINGIYQIGFEVQDGAFLGKDGVPSVAATQVAEWLTQFFTNRGTTNTGLDRIIKLILADGSLASKTPWSAIAGGIEAANGMNLLYHQAITQLNLAADGAISEADILAINNWIRSDAARYQAYVNFHGDDESMVETGFHLIGGNGANTMYFKLNFVNTVLDGMYHIGEIIQDGRFRNEDGNPNAMVKSVADWVTYFYIDHSTTGTGLDVIVDTIKTDAALALTAGSINQGAIAANSLNHLIIEAIGQTQVDNDGWITADDIRTLNTWIRNNRYDTFLALYGDSVNGIETGYQSVQNNGALTRYFGKNLINDVADSIYNLGFNIQGNNVLTKDGRIKASINSVASWLNYFYGAKNIIDGTNDAQAIAGSAQDDYIQGYSGNDTIAGGEGSDLIEGGWGNDVIDGGLGNDILYGNANDDSLNGGEGSDQYIINGNEAEGVSSFQGYDTYSDTGLTGIDQILAIGAGNVDIGLTGISASSGIEIIDGTGAVGTVRLLGSWGANLLDFSNIQFVGTNLQIFGNYGNDTIIGNSADNTIVGGGNDDNVNGGGGSDRYLVTGNEAGGWSSFQGYDTYNDTGLTGIDQILAIGEGNVDIGLTGISASSGIEIIDGTGATGAVRLLGSWGANLLDFSNIQLVGNNLQINGNYGNDTIMGNNADNIIVGGGHDDSLNGGDGSDRYIVTGNEAGGWSSFQGYDTYNDTGVNGIDQILAIGEGNVDIGLTGISASSGIEIIDGTGATGIVRLLGSRLANLLDFSSIDLIGSNFQIHGAVGNDTIIGSKGNDFIVGGNDNDNLAGGLGADTLTGGQGRDTLTGGLGKDEFIFNSISEMGLGSSRDVITDFTLTDQDLIDLSAIDANTLIVGDQAFSYIAAGSFTRNAGELRFANGILAGDINGDAIADFELGITGLTSLTAASIRL